MPTRSALPQNYIIASGTRIENFGTFADWTNATPSAGTISEDATYYRSPATKSLKLTASAGQALQAYKATSSIDLSASSRSMRLWVYVDDPTYLSTVTIYLADQLGPSRYAFFTCDGSGGRLHQGWNLIVLTRVDADLNEGFSWQNPILRLKVGLSATAGGSCSVSFAEFTAGEEALPRIMVQFDDAALSEYTEGFEYLYNQKGKPGTIWAVPASLGTSGFMTKAQLDVVYAAGWAVGNHTYDHTVLTTLSKADQATKIQQGYNWLIDNGYTRAAKHVSYPNGQANSDTLEVMSELGMLTGRRVSESPSNKMVLDGTPLVSPYSLHGVLVHWNNAEIPVSMVKGWIDTVVTTGGLLTLVFHSLKSSGLSADMDYLIDDFKAIIDYAIQRGMKFVTIDEWYNGLTNPRYRSVPLTRVAI